MTKFNYFLEALNSAQSIDGYDVLIQENVIDQVENKYHLRFIPMKPGKLNFFRGLRFMSFWKYDRLVLPVYYLDLHNYSNLFFFALPILSKTYQVCDPDDIDRSSETYSFLRFVWNSFVFSAAEIGAVAAMLAAGPFVWMKACFKDR